MEKLNKYLLKIEEVFGITFTEDEIINLIEKDLCSKARLFKDYIILKNVYDTINDIKNKDLILYRNLNNSDKEKIKKIFE